MYRKFLKRFFDIIFSLCLIIILSPIIFITYLMIIVFLGTPAVFKQKRPGYNEKIFTIYKFRTMVEKKDAFGDLLPDEQRLTRFGNFIRKTSLDELPQLFNVFMGDMSFIGPRPLLVEYLSLYDNNQKKRHHVRPGITGWAQVNGRNAISWEEKFELDQYYAENMNFFLDIKIFFLTIYKVLKRTDISSDTHVTVDKFTGKTKEIHENK